MSLSFLKNLTKSLQVTENKIKDELNDFYENTIKTIYYPSVNYKEFKKYAEENTK